MHALRFVILIVVLIGLCLTDATGQDGDKKFKFKKGAPSTPLTAQDLSAPLVPADILAKLQLTPEQRPTATKLSQEFTAKNKELVAKVPATPPVPEKGKFKGKGKGAAPTSPALLAVLALRSEYEKKFEELLTEAQKKSYDALLARRAEGLLGGK